MVLPERTDVFQRTFAGFPDAVGCIDGTSHLIYRPQVENEPLYYSGHRHFYCLHMQVVIENNFYPRHVESGYFGHFNDEIIELWLS